MVWTVKVLGEPAQVSALSVPLGRCVGRRVWRPLAPAPTVVTKVNVLPLQLRPRIVELFRPSTHVRSCLYEMTETPCACAEATIASSLAFGAGESVWMFVPKAP